MKAYLSKTEIVALLNKQIKFKNTNEYIIGFLVDGNSSKYAYKSLYCQPIETDTKKTFIERVISLIETECMGIYDISADVMIPYKK